MYKQVVIIGGGVSIKEGIKLNLWEELQKNNIEVWSINFAFMTMPFLPNKEIWLDYSFFRNNMEKLQNLYKQGVSCYTKINNKYALIPEITTYITTRDPNEMDKKLFVGRMGLSGYLALSLAVRERYDIIYLLGYDWGSVTNDKNTHYYQNDLKVMSTGFGRPELYVVNGNVKDEVKDFELFLNYNSKIVNVSPKSNINCFEKIDYTTFFQRIKNEV